MQSEIEPSEEILEMCRKAIEDAYPTGVASFIHEIEGSSVKLVKDSVLGDKNRFWYGPTYVNSEHPLEEVDLNNTEIGFHYWWPNGEDPVWGSLSDISAEVRIVDGKVDSVEFTVD